MFKSVDISVFNESDSEAAVIDPPAREIVLPAREMLCPLREATLPDCPEILPETLSPVTKFRVISLDNQVVLLLLVGTAFL